MRSLEYVGFDPAQEGLREALCTLGNGRFATRGATPESSADGIHYPGTYLAGYYDRLPTEVAGLVVQNESLVNVPNWLPLTFRIEGGPWFDPAEVELLDYRQRLDIAAGVLRREVRFRDAAGRTTSLSERRFVHMSRPHLAGLETTLTAEDWSGRVDVRVALDGRVRNEGVARYRDLAKDHLAGVRSEQVDAETIALEVSTVQSHLHVAEAARIRLFSDGAPAEAERTLASEPRYVCHEISTTLERGRPLQVEKIVALAGTRDHAISEPYEETIREIARAEDFDTLLGSHALAWRQQWDRFRLDLGQGRHEDMVLDLHILHVLQTVSENTVGLDVGVPARGLHGEAYRGHIFWDELFVFPFLNLHLPELTRSLLDYRVRRLGEARWAAREAGYAGAMFPWQSGSDGREESQVLHLNPRSGRWVPDHTYLQRHINSAVAYNLWEYFEVTGDQEFLSSYGAEVIVEIARFWASIARFDPGSGRYRIRGVMGPDEYHDSYPWSDEPGLDDNAYTNVLAAWVLARAIEVLELLPQHRARELWDQLGLRAEELEEWDDITRRMKVPFHGDGIISQFDGYERLEELDWDDLRRRYGDIRRLDRILEAEGDSVNRFRASKQADVLMLFYLFSAEDLTAVLSRMGYDYDPERIPPTIDYYLRRTSHGSTLSGVVHSWVLARSDRPRSWCYFQEALEADVGDVQGGTTPEGIHLGAMAGTIDLVQRGYTGISMREGVLWLNPVLPVELGELDFSLRFRGQPIDMRISRDTLRVSTDWSLREPVRVGFAGEIHELEPGSSIEFPLSMPAAHPA